MPKRSELPAEERVKVVLSLLRKEEPISVLSRRYGVSEQTLYRWRDEFVAGGKDRLPERSIGSVVDSSSPVFSSRIGIVSSHSLLIYQVPFMCPRKHTPRRSASLQKLLMRRTTRTPSSSTNGPLSLVTSRPVQASRSTPLRSVRTRNRAAIA